VELSQHWQAGRRLAFQQDQDDWYSTVARLAVFIKLPSTQALFSDEEHERVRLRNFIGKLLQPIATCPQAFGRKKDLRLGVLAPQRLLERLRERQVLRIVTQKPASHSNHRISSHHAQRSAVQRLFSSINP
jgi:hypothetical protein